MANEPKKVRTTLYLEPELWKQIQIEGIRRGEYATVLVNWAIADWLKKQKGGR